MGQLMSVRKCGGGGCSLDLDVDLLDLYNNAYPTTASDDPAAIPDPEAASLHVAMAALLQQSAACIQAVRGYADLTEGLRAAMGSPNDDALQLRAFASLLPNIAVIKQAYDLSASLAQELPRLLAFLVARRASLREHQSLLKQLADVLDFSLSCDYEKMMKPALQNDFSYYRRHLHKMGPRVAGVQVQEAEAGIISMFIAQALPMTVTVEQAVKAAGSGGGKGGMPAADGGVCEAVQVVGLLANVTCDLALRPGLDEAARRYALRVMTSAVVLYDRVSATGVFTRRSLVRTRKCLRTLRREQDDGTASAPLAQQLLNSVKYSTLHFKDVSTPGYIRSLLSD